MIPSGWKRRGPRSRTVDTIYKVRNLEAGYGPLKVLKQVSLHVATGEMVTLADRARPTGAGKSACCPRAPVGFTHPARGRLLDGKPVRGIPAERIVDLDSGPSVPKEHLQVFSATGMFG